ncbi:hypothetical protein DPEC_G00264320 [Dallia pectoralis]|uniref:Uncharacterized protein n=1 Tax=Dallia pectoralis TaxID=75939 RepID=A0ACC2FSL3_DALPE|nr:hypothetical protein DPEC_G00264320 [Dallia pectoralis]
MATVHLWCSLYLYSIDFVKRCNLISKMPFRCLFLCTLHSYKVFFTYCPIIKAQCQYRFLIFLLILLQGNCNNCKTCVFFYFHFNSFHGCGSFNSTKFYHYQMCLCNTNTCAYIFYLLVLS